MALVPKSILGKGLGQSIGRNRAQGTSFAAFTGTEQVIARLNIEIGKIKNQTRAGMQDALMIVKAASLPLTPIDQGNLRGSVYTYVRDEPDGPVGIIGYGGATAFYAVYVHEIQKNYKAPGTQWKYLSTALAITASEVLDAIAKRARIQ